MSDTLTQPGLEGRIGEGQNPLYFHPCRETNTDFVLESRGLNKQKKGVCLALTQESIMGYYLII
jgi:hypothetical protein